MKGGEGPNDEKYPSREGGTEDEGSNLWMEAESQRIVGFPTLSRTVPRPS